MGVSGVERMCARSNHTSGPSQHSPSEPADRQGHIYPTLYVTRDEFETVTVPDPYLKFLVIRDLRDVLVSDYFYWKHSHVPLHLSRPGPPHRQADRLRWHHHLGHDQAGRPAAPLPGHFQGRAEVRVQGHDAVRGGIAKNHRVV